MSTSKPQAEFVALNLAVITVSDTRSEENDESGHLLASALQEAGHYLAAKHIVKDDVYRLRALVATLVADDAIHGILVTGGTGFTTRDNTVSALKPLFDVEIEGFGELFRQLSHQEIGSSTIQSRAFAGLSNNTGIFCMPGSPGACRTAWEKILHQQLDSRHRPCNFSARLRLRD